MSEIEKLRAELAEHPEATEPRHRLIRLYLQAGDVESMRAASEELSVLKLLRPPS